MTTKICDIPGMLSALNQHIKDLLKGGIANWMQLVEINDCIADNPNYSLLRLWKLDRQWQQHDPIPLAIKVRLHDISNVHTPSSISRCADLLVGFVRLHSVSEPTILHLTIGNHDVSQVCLGAHAGSFVYAHDNRFVIPLVSLQFSDPQCTNLHENNKNIGIVYAHLRREESCGLAKNRIFAHVDTDKTMIYSSGMMFKNNNTNSNVNNVNNVNNETNNDLIELLDMQDLDGKQRSLERCRLIFNELMAITWHPKRIRQWCLEYDDEFAL